MENVGNCTQVDDFKHRIGRRFKEAANGVVAHRRAPLIQIAAVDKGRFDSEPG